MLRRFPQMSRSGSRLEWAALSRSARTARRRSSTRTKAERVIAAARGLGAARPRAARRHRAGVDAGDDRRLGARGGAGRRRRSRADAVVLQGADDARRVRAPLHGGCRRLAGAGPALQRSRGDRRQSDARRRRPARDRIRTSSASRKPGSDTAQFAAFVAAAPESRSRSSPDRRRRSIRRSASAPRAASSRSRASCRRSASNCTSTSAPAATTRHAPCSGGSRHSPSS